MFASIKKLLQPDISEAKKKVTAPIKVTRPNLSLLSQVGKASAKQNDHNFTRSTTDMDNHADMCCVSPNFTPYSYTGEEFSVSPYKDTYKPIHNVPVCSACMAVEHFESGETLICDVNQALYFGQQLSNSLLNPNQIKSHGLIVNDNPFETQ